MTEDVIEFGAARDRGRRRPRLGLSHSGLSPHPQLPKFLAAAGALAGFASLLAPWRAVTLPGDFEEAESRFFQAYLLGKVAVGMSGHAAGTPYLVALIGLATVVTLTLFGTPGVRHTACIAGLALCGGTLAMVGAAGYTLTQLHDLASYLPETLEEYGSRPDTGFWAAVAALLLAGAALLLSRAPQPSPGAGSPVGPGGAAGEAQHDPHLGDSRDPGDLELTVAEAPPVRFPG